VYVLTSSMVIRNHFFFLEWGRPQNIHRHTLSPLESVEAIHYIHSRPEWGHLRFEDLEKEGMMEELCQK
jgi:hypothetical protein